MSAQTGRIDCQCGDQIISNSGKTMYKGSGIICCWNEKCGKAYDYNTLEKLREDNKVVVFNYPGKELKVFRMDECDWWLDISLDKAIDNYSNFIGIRKENVVENKPIELTPEQLETNEFYPDGDFSKMHSFKIELQRRQSISSKPEFFASTEF